MSLWKGNFHQFYNEPKLSLFTHLLMEMKYVSNCYLLQREQHWKMLRKSLCDRIKQPLWTTTKSHTAEPSGLSVSNFVRKCCADFHSGHISLHSYQQWINIFASVNAGQHELSCVYWSWQIWLVKIKSQNCLICISLSTKDIDHFFKLWWIGLVVFVCWC